MKKEAVSYSELEDARRQLGLSDRATMQEIKSAYRRLVRQYHPDTTTFSSKDAVEIMKGINRSYHVIMEYCKNYRFSFLKGDFDLNYPELNFQERFRDDWLSS